MGWVEHLAEMGWRERKSYPASTTLSMTVGPLSWGRLPNLGFSLVRGVGGRPQLSADAAPLRGMVRGVGEIEHAEIGGWEWLLCDEQQAARVRVDFGPHLRRFPWGLVVPGFIAVYHNATDLSERQLVEAARWSARMAQRLPRKRRFSTPKGAIQQALRAVEHYRKRIGSAQQQRIERSIEATKASLAKLEAQLREVEAGGARQEWTLPLLRKILQDKGSSLKALFFGSDFGASLPSLVAVYGPWRTTSQPGRWPRGKFGGRDWNEEHPREWIVPEAFVHIQYDDPLGFRVLAADGYAHPHCHVQWSDSGMMCLGHHDGTQASLEARLRKSHATDLKEYLRLVEGLLVFHNERHPSGRYHPFFLSGTPARKQRSRRRA